jgi:hypothetical protein
MRREISECGRVGGRYLAARLLDSLVLRLLVVAVAPRLKKRRKIENNRITRDV